MAMLLLAAAVIALSMPIFATVLVAFVSRREDKTWTLGGAAPGRVEAIARRIVGFRSHKLIVPVPKNRARRRERETLQTVPDRGQRVREGLVIGSRHG